MTRCDLNIQSCRPAMVMAVASALASLAIAGTPTAPAIDWNERIRSTLAETGDLSSLATELSLAAPSANVRQAQIRLELENGNLDAALGLLQNESTARPDDAGLLERIARLQEMIAQPEAAVQTYESAARLTRDAAHRGSLYLRLSTLAFDGNEPERGVKLLRQAVEADAAGAGRAAMVAFLYGRFTEASHLFRGQPTGTVSSRLLEGNAALMSGDTNNAAAAFDAALSLATRPADRAYAIERQIAAARQSHTLAALADAWLADPNLPNDRLLPLATTLRELNRVPQLLQWWQADATKPNRSETMLSARFVNEVLGAARSAGRGDEAVNVCQEMLDREPTSWQWLTALVRAKLGIGQADAADELLRARLAAVKESPASVQQLGRLARTFGRETVAIEAADLLGTFGGNNAVAGRLLAATVYDRAGDSSRANNALDAATALALRDPAAVSEVVSALEAADRKEQAIDLLQATLKDSPDDEATLSRLASLLLKTGQNARAVSIFDKLMHTAASPVVRQQSAQRLLEASAEMKATDKLAVQLQSRLRSGQGTAQDLSLLVDALISLKQIDAAAATLETTTLLSDAEKARELAFLFLRNNQPERADAALRTLLVLDPADANDTLERIASVALSRKKPDEAAAAMQQIEAKSGPGPQTIGLMAGVYNRLGRMADAAAQYRRLLAINPDNASDWLLWSTAMNKMGQTALAGQRLQVLCDEAATDNLFAAAVDGMLNLNAPPNALRVARRNAILRLADRPQAFMLYHVLSDLSDELLDPEAMVRATKASVSASVEERAQRLRELMDVATQNGLTETAIDCGRSLLALGDDFPPQLFLELGGQLLATNRPDEAQRAFARAMEVSDPDFIATQAATMLERFGYPAGALDLLRPLVDRRKVDLKFRQHLAMLAEVVGRSDEAASTYQAAAKLAISAAKTVPPDRTMYNDGADILFEAVSGALMTGRSPEQREAVLTMLESALRERLAAHSGETEPPADLVRLATALRRAAQFCDSVERADRADDAIAKTWPDGRAFLERVVQDRLQSGRIDSAIAFGKAFRVESPTLGRYVAAIESAATTRPTQPTIEQAAQLLPVLIANNELDQARSILEIVSETAAMPPSDGRQPDLKSPARTLIMAANALGDDRSAVRLILAWADTFDPITPASQPPSSAASGPTSLPQTADPSGQVAASYLTLVNACWPVLPEAARIALIDRMRQQFHASQNPDVRTNLAGYVLQLSVATGYRFADVGTLAETVLARNGQNPADVIRWSLALSPEADRPALLRTLVDRVEAGRRLSILMAVVGRSAEAFNANTERTIIDLVQTLPAGQLIDWSDWFIHAQRPELLRAFAEASLRTAVAAQPGDVAHASLRAAAAAAFANAGDIDRADTLANESLSSLASFVSPKADPRQPRNLRRGPMSLQPDRLTVLRVAVAAMSAKARQAALANADDTTGASRTPTQAPWRAALRVTLLAVSGERDAAMNVLRSGLQQNASDPLLLGLYRSRLVDDGRLAELASLTQQTAGRSSPAAALRPEVSHALRDLFRWREQPDLDQSPDTTTDFTLPLAAGDLDQLAAAFRTTLQQVRIAWPGRFSSVDAGGLATTAQPGRYEPPAFLDAFPNWPGSLDDALLTLHCNDLGTLSADWLAVLVTRVAKTNEQVRERLIAQLTRSAAAGTLSAGERTAISQLADVPGISMPPAWADALKAVACANPTTSDMARYADLLSAKSPSDVHRKWARLTAYNTVMGALAPRSDGSPLGFRPSVPFTATDLSVVADRDAGAAQKQFDVLRSNGQLAARSIDTRLVGVRLIGEAGDVNAYATVFNEVLSDWAWQQAAGRAALRGSVDDDNLIDLSLALPRSVDAERRGNIGRVVHDTLVRLAERWPDQTDLCRIAARAGESFVDAGDSASAEALLQFSTDIGQKMGVGEHRLWTADLAERLGQRALSTSIQKSLLEARCLPSLRIAPLLQRLRDDGHADEAERLAMDAAQYCAEPKLRTFINQRSK